MHTIETLVKPVVAAASLQAHEAWLVNTLVASVDHVESWAARYLASGLLDVPDVPEADLERVIGGLGLGQELSSRVKNLWNDAVEVCLDPSPARSSELKKRGWTRSSTRMRPLAQALTSRGARSRSPSTCPSGRCVGPLRVPLSRACADPPARRQVVSAVRLSIAAKMPLAIGQSVSCAMTISTTTQWSGGGPPPSELAMCYDLSAEFEHWLVSGRKKGTFIARVRSSPASIL